MEFSGSAFDIFGDRIKQLAFDYHDPIFKDTVMGYSPRFIKILYTVFRQLVEISIGMNRAPLVADLFLFC